MNKLQPIFRFLPLPLVLYGLVSSALELLNVHLTIDAIRFSAMGTEPSSAYADRIIALRGYVFSLDSFFFYSGLAAIVAFLIRKERGDV